ncbi:MAG: hypothetical protein AAF628_36295 [Planctomycetota bacterium]
MRRFSLSALPLSVALLAPVAVAQPGPTGVFSFVVKEDLGPFPAPEKLCTGSATYDGSRLKVATYVEGSPAAVDVFDCVSGALVLALVPTARQGALTTWCRSITGLGRSETSLLNDLFEVRLSDSSGAVLARNKLELIRSFCFVGEDDIAQATLNVSTPTGYYEVDLKEKFLAPASILQAFLLVGTAASPGAEIEELETTYTLSDEFEAYGRAPQFSDDFASGNVVLKLVTTSGDVFLDLAKKDTRIGYASGPTALARVRLPLQPGNNEIFGDGEAEGMTPTSGRILDLVTGQTLGTFTAAADAAGSSFTLRTTLTSSGMQTLRNGSAGVELTDGVNTIVGPAIAPIPIWASGVGCVGSNGEELLLDAAGPVALIQGSFDFEVAHALSGGTVAVLIGGPTPTLGIPLPVPLEGLGAPGCFWMGPFLVALPLLADGNGRATLALPTSFSAFYTELNAQVLGLDPSANPLGVTSSNLLTIPLN